MYKKIILAAVMVIFASFTFAADVKSAAGDENAASMKKETKESWDTLEPDEKEKIRKIYSDWEEVSHEKKMWIIKNHKKLKEMDPEEKERLKEAYKEWEKLSPHMKKILKEKYEQWKKLSPEEKQKIKKAYEKYQKMSPAERKVLREKAKEKK
ncbi:MAG: DUF3106 domain-containing protein [Candidatus Goldbacteria bacterium]|nr:DUF3106 domain-containing protein [Candidatus Goldiibacteriota bacterium]